MEVGENQSWKKIMIKYFYTVAGDWGEGEDWSMKSPGIKIDLETLPFMTALGDCQASGTFYHMANDLCSDSWVIKLRKLV